MKRNDRVATIFFIAALLTLGTAANGQLPASNDTSDANFNTGGGSLALVANTSGTGNTGYGYKALSSNSTGFDNTAVGAGALYANSSGLRNTAIGQNALAVNTTGNSNSAVGQQALYVNATGSNNTAIGSYALFRNKTGSYNTATGYLALAGAFLATTSGSWNTATGAFAAYNTIGLSNTANGYAALYSNTGGGQNTANGYEALYNNTGGLNTALGYNALLKSTMGSRNLALGWSAGYNQTTGSGNIYLANLGVAGESNTMRLGQDVASGGDTLRAFIAGVVGVPVTGSQVLINSQGQLGVLVSSARYKHDIHDMGEQSKGLLKLRPVIFRYKQDPEAALQYGLIAEEVAKVYPELVVRGAKGEVESVQYHQLIPMLLNEVQHQQKQLADLKAQNERLQAALVEQNRELAARLEQLERTASRNERGNGAHPSLAHVK